MKSALDVHRALLAAGVAHEMVRVRGSVLSVDDLPRALGVDPSLCAALRCYIASWPDGRDGFVAVMVRAGDTADPASLLDALGASTVRPATADETNEATDYAAPLVSPIALDDRVLLLADAALGGSDVLYAATGESGVALGIRTRDLLVASGARVTTLTARPLAADERLVWDRSDGLADARVIDLDPARRAAPRPARRARTAR